jgi:putative toxin-antitoxin system antitoxin component (TIGR02293 family)
MSKVAAILGGERELGQRIRKPVDFDAIIKKGMPWGALYYVKKAYALPDEAIARIIGVSPRTVVRRRTAPKGIELTGNRLSPVESDRLYRFARIVALAEDVFENREDAIEWLNRKQHGLGGAVPISMLQTDAGCREVEELLLRIEHGVIS